MSVELKKRTRRTTRSEPVKDVYVETLDSSSELNIKIVESEPSQPTTKNRVEKRKPKTVYNGFNAQLPTTSEEENIILKLNITHEGETLGEDEVVSIPDAYNLAQCDAFSSKPVELEIEPYDEPKETHMNTDNIIENENPNMKLKVVQLLKDFEEKNKNNEWPTNTSIACYWCCHKFDNPPFGIPVKYVNEQFHVFGCFCSLECAAAYNLDSKDSIDEMWERMNLINLLSRKLGGYTQGFIKPAPNRLALSMFGGHMSIDEFRKFTETGKIININFPPMMTMTQQIEEINESDINNEFKYIPLDTDRVNKYKEKIKLKRTKPLHDFKNTLDHAMNLKFGGGSAQ